MVYCPISDFTPRAYRSQDSEHRVQSLISKRIEIDNASCTSTSNTIMQPFNLLDGLDQPLCRALNLQRLYSTFIRGTLNILPPVEHACMCLVP